MLIDSNDRLWIGTSNEVLFKLTMKSTDIKKGKFDIEHFKYELSDPASGKIEKINTILKPAMANYGLVAMGTGCTGSKKIKNYYKIYQT